VLAQRAQRELSRQPAPALACGGIAPIAARGNLRLGRRTCVNSFGISSVAGQNKVMRVPLRVLIAEDSEQDLELLLRELGRGGFDVVHRHVATAEAMRSALADGNWDIVLSDYSMP